MDKVKLVKDVERYSLMVGFACIIFGIFIPQLNYVSTGAFAITYITALIREFQKNGKIKLISFLLCTASMSWVVLRQFTESPYLGLFGQLIIYAYLINTQYQFLGKVQKSFLVYLVCAVSINTLNVFYPSKVVAILGILMQIWILFRFLDPILEDIALKHRAKRLDEEAKAREGDIVEGMIIEEKIAEETASEIEEKEEVVWKTETTQVPLHG